MIRAKLVVVGQSARSFRSVSGRAGVKRWNVTKLQGDCKDDSGTVTAKGRFLESARKGLKGKWDTGISVQEQWDVLSFVMCDAAHEWLGYEDIGGNQIGSGREVDLKPMLVERNRMHTYCVAERWQRNK